MDLSGERNYRICFKDSRNSRSFSLFLLISFCANILQQVTFPSFPCVLERYSSSQYVRWTLLWLAGESMCTSVEFIKFQPRGHKDMTRISIFCIMFYLVLGVSCIYKVLYGISSVIQDFLAQLMINFKRCMLVQCTAKRLGQGYPTGLPLSMWQESVRLYHSSQKCTCNIGPNLVLDGLESI